MTTAWRVPRTSQWRIKRRLPRPTTRDRLLIAILLTGTLAAAVTCSVIGHHTKTSFGDPGGPFIATVVDKEISMPPSKQIAPVEFFLVVQEANGRQRHVVVRFADYARSHRGTVMTRDAAGRVVFR